MADYKFDIKTDAPASYSTPEDDKSIVRLVEDPDIKKTIKFDEMSYSPNYGPNDIQGGDKSTDDMGLLFPAIRINDMMMPRSCITKMKISMAGFVPTIVLFLDFEDRTFISKSMPKDGDMISLFLRSSTNALSYIRADFIITSGGSKTGSTLSSRCSLKLFGRMYIDKFDVKNTCEAYAGTSKNVLMQLSKKLGIGFAFNDFEDSNDYQNWIRCRESIETFVGNVISHAWKDNTSFFKSWIDLYYNLCYVNVNKFLLSDGNEEKVDMTFFSNIVDAYNLQSPEQDVNEAKATPKILTNAANFKRGPFYIKNWYPKNVSTGISLSVGYSTSVYQFLHNQEILSKDQNDSFSLLEMIPAYDPKKTDSNIILRGRSRYDSGANPDGEMERVNYNFVDTYNRVAWSGVEYTMSDNDKDTSPNEWKGNVHKNYGNALYHNEQNLAELDKMYLYVEVSGLNLQIMKGERVPVYILHNNKIEEDRYNSFSKNDLPIEGNRFYSGYYYVDSIEYEYDLKNTEDTSPYTTKYILKRREWPTPEAI